MPPGCFPAHANGVEPPQPRLAQERAQPWVRSKRRTHPFAVPSSSAPPRLCARQVPFRLKPDTWFSRRGAGTQWEPNAPPLPSSRLCGFAALPTLSVHKNGTKGKSRQASKPQRRERIRANRNVPKKATPQSGTGSAARRRKRTLFPSDEAALPEPSPRRQPPHDLPHSLQFYGTDAIAPSSVAGRPHCPIWMLTRACEAGSSWIRLPTDGATGDPEGITGLPGGDRCLFRGSETSVHRIHVDGFRRIMGRTSRYQRDHVLPIQEVDRVSCGSPFDEFSQLRLCLADDVGLHDLNETPSRPGVNPTPVES
jgi:hypothetical protein